MMNRFALLLLLLFGAIANAAAQPGPIPPPSPATFIQSVNTVSSITGANWSGQLYLRTLGRYAPFDGEAGVYAQTTSCVVDGFACVQDIAGDYFELSQNFDLTGTPYENFQTETSLTGKFSFFRYTTSYGVNSLGNIASFAAGAARFVYNPITKFQQGLGVAQNTYQILTGLNMAATPWGVGVGDTWTANSVTGPDGMTSMGLFTEASGSSLHGIYTIVPNGIQPLTNTFSVYMRAGTRRYVQLAWDDTFSASTPNTAGIVIDTTTWTVCAQGVTGGDVNNSTSIVASSNGTWRVNWNFSHITRNAAVNGTDIEITGLDSCAYVAPPNQTSSGSDTFYASNPNLTSGDPGMAWISQTNSSRYADIATYTPPAGFNTATFTFPDGTNQIRQVVAGLPTTLPLDLNEPIIAYLNFSNTAAPQDVLVWHGDSITQGVNATHPASTYVAQQVTAAFGFTPLTVNRGVSGIGYCQGASPYGQTANNMVQDAPAYIDPVVTAYPKARLILNGAGVNDLANGHTVAQTYTCFQNYMAARITAGWTQGQIWVGTEPDSNSGVSAANIAAFNADLVAYCGTNGCNLIRYDLVSGLGVAGSYSGPNFNDDQLHPDTAGQQLMATTAFSAIYP